AAGEREPERPQVAADRLQLAYERARLEPRLGELASAGERLGGVHRSRRRLEHELRVLARLDEVARAAQHGRRRDRHADARRQLLVAERGERLRREAAQPREVEAYVVARQAELLEVRAHRLGREAELAQVGEGGGAVALRQLAAVLAEQEAVVDVLGRLAAERADQLRL